MQINTLVLGEIGTNCYILYDETTKGAVIVDPADSADLIFENVEKSGVKPEAVLLTHGHWDHCFAAKKVAEHYNIPIVSEEDEKEVLADPEKNLTVNHEPGPEVIVPDITVKEGDEITFGGMKAEVLHTPGHTKGSCCYFYRENGVLIAGDTMFCNGYGRTDLPTGSMAALYRSMKRLCTELPDETIVYPGHGPATSIGYEKRAYDFKG